MEPTPGAANILWFEELDSSNAELRRRMGGLSGGLDNLSIVAANSQTAGRGQGDHSWFSSPGMNLTFSLLLRFNVPSDAAASFSASSSESTTAVAAAAPHQEAPKASAALSGYSASSSLKPSAAPTPPQAVPPLMMPRVAQVSGTTGGPLSESAVTEAAEATVDNVPGCGANQPFLHLASEKSELAVQNSPFCTWQGEKSELAVQNSPFCTWHAENQISRCKSALSAPGESASASTAASWQGSEAEATNSKWSAASQVPSELENLEAREAVLISCAVTLGIRDYLLGRGVEARIKWPNDIWVGDRKICGILIENVLSGAFVRSSIVGVGLNLNQTEWPEELPNPISLKQLTGKSFHPADELVFLYKGICRRIAMMQSPDGRSSLQGEYGKYMFRLP